MRREERKRLRAKEKNRYNLISREFKNILRIYSNKEDRHEFYAYQLLDNDGKLRLKMFYSPYTKRLLFVPALRNNRGFIMRYSEEYEIFFDDAGKLVSTNYKDQITLHQTYRYLLDQYFNSDHTKLILFIQTWAIDIL